MNKKQAHPALLPVLKALQKQLKKNPPGPFATSNLLKDLKAVLTRMRVGFYDESDFIDRNIFDWPRRTWEFHNYLAGCQDQADTWAAILKPLLNQGTKTILDICPGWSAKVEMALYQLPFSGRVMLYDNDPLSVKHILDFMKLFRISFGIKAFRADFFCPPKKPPQAQLVVANHIIDDLLLNEHCKAHGLELADVYTSEASLDQAVQTIMGEGSPAQARFAHRVFERLEACTPKGASLVVVQYPGHFEKAKQMGHWSNHCKDTLNIMKGLFGATRLYTNLDPLIQKALRPLKNRYFEAGDVMAFRRE